MEEKLIRAIIYILLIATAGLGWAQAVLLIKKWNRLPENIKKIYDIEK